MSKFIAMLDALDEACKCGKGKDCKCKKGIKCDGKCDCKTVKEDAELDEKRMSDDEGDFRLNDKKDRKAEAKGKKVPEKQYQAEFPKKIKENTLTKYDKYLLECEEADLQEKEDQLMEGTLTGDVRKEILAAGLGIGVPSSGLTVDAYRNILAKLQAKGLNDLAGKLKSAVTWSTVEQQNMKKF